MRHQMFHIVQDFPSRQRSNANSQRAANLHPLELYLASARSPEWNKVGPFYNAYLAPIESALLYMDAGIFKNRLDRCFFDNLP